MLDIFGYEIYLEKVLLLKIHDFTIVVKMNTVFKSLTKVDKRY